jgi:hypothetical protein
LQSQFGKNQGLFCKTISPILMYPEKLDSSRQRPGAIASGENARYMIGTNSDTESCALL